MRSEAESYLSIGPEIANPGADLANFLNFFGICDGGTGRRLEYSEKFSTLRGEQVRI